MFCWKCWQFSIVIFLKFIASGTCLQDDRNISINGDQIMLDGQPFRIISGSAHYFRSPHQHWPDILQKIKAAGLNTVATYVEWSSHEPEERQYYFEGDTDIELFLMIATKKNLYVLLRVGPYIGSERDLGGLPYWLLSKYPEIKLRTTDKDFMNETSVWLVELFKRVSPYLYGNGGPIILVQVENEFGSFGNDTAYKEQLRYMFLKHVGGKALLYTTDGNSPDFLENGHIKDTMPTGDFAPGGNVIDYFKILSEFTNGGPVMNSEFYCGWFSYWGDKYKSTISTSVVTKSLKEILEYKNGKANVNLYMFHGGTNFGFGSGANSPKTYKPVITSYDYDAPLDEATNPTKKYYAIRETISQFNPDVKNIPVPQVKKAVSYGEVRMIACLRLLSDKGRSQMGRLYAKTTGNRLLSFEQLRQRAGFVLYETTLNDVNSNGNITIDYPRDRIYVYVDGKLNGIISRIHSSRNVDIKSHYGSKLSLLVENQGRTGPHWSDWKGIISDVKYNGNILEGTWKMTGFPLQEMNPKCDDVDDPTNLDKGPIIYTSQLKTTNQLDTYFNPMGWGKGSLWINQHNIGRYWALQTPQVTLYVPGVWMEPKTTIYMLELEQAPSDLNIQFINHTIFY